MSALPPPPRALHRVGDASHRVRLLALGLAVACSVGVATPSVAAAPGLASAVRTAPGADDPSKAKKQVDPKAAWEACQKAGFQPTKLIGPQGTFVANEKTKAPEKIAEAPAAKRG